MTNRKLLLWCLATAASCLWGSAARAEEDARAFANPPRLLARQETASQPNRLLQAAPAAAPGVAAPTAALEKVDFDLYVHYVRAKIWNPSTGTYDAVKLRSYSEQPLDPKDPKVTRMSDAPLVAPLVEASPGQTVSLTLHNQLDPDSTCTWHDQPTNTPHCFNGTNLHSHGLWVSPAGNGDNVLLSVNPGVGFQYIYNLPLDHPAGTFWYHSHRHGSTALQVSSGMAGAMIVRGDRAPTLARTGDIDVILRKPDLSRLDEQVLVLQQIQYACLDKSGAVKVKTKKDGDEDVVVAWVCDPGDTGVVESYDYPGGQGFSPQSWAQSGRFTTVNGLVRPALKATAGEPQRWRMIHGGVRDTITVGFKRLKPEAAPLVGMLAVHDGAAFVDRNCTGDLLSYEQIAADGLTMGHARAATVSTLQPGYRYDALVTFPEAGRYCIIDMSAPPAGSVSRDTAERQLLGTVDVAAGTGAPVSLVDRLSAIALNPKVLPLEIGAKVDRDLRDGLKFTSFVPHPDIDAAEVTGKQALTFFINIGPTTATAFDVGDVKIDPHHFDPATFHPEPYDPNRVDRVLKLGGVDEWTLQSGFVSHPFHIHVNPFQIVSIIDPNGRDVSAEGVADNGGGAYDPQYQGLKGVWKDTIWVKNLISNPANFPAQLASSMYTITVRTRYERYIGEFVLHCHILDHEDQGMMQNVSIQVPDGLGGVAAAHH